MDRVFKCGLLGEKVDYSRSPEIFGHIFAAENRNGLWRTVNCSHAELNSCLTRLREESFDGLSVTIPHKEAIIPFLDEIDDIAGSLGSVNSILLRNGRATGYNTDTYGFVRPLLPDAAFLKGKTALVLGSGGAARSAGYSLMVDFEVAELVLAGRNEERLDHTLTRLKQALPRAAIRGVQWKDTRFSKLITGAGAQEPALIVNATPLGGPNQNSRPSEEVFDSIPASAIYYDLNYNGDNELVKAAQKHGLRTLNGLPMLIHQALRSYYLWTGYQASFSDILNRMEAHAT